MAVCQKLSYDSDQGELAQASAAAAPSSRMTAPTSSVWMNLWIGTRTACDEVGRFPQDPWNVARSILHSQRLDTDVNALRRITSDGVILGYHLRRAMFIPFRFDYAVN